MDGDITSQEKQVLDTQRASHIIEQYYCQRWNVSMEYLSTLNWEVYTKVYRQSAPNIQRYIIKLMTGWLPVHHHMNKMLQEKRTCPLCSKDETIAHLFRCEHRDEWRISLMTNCETQLTKLKTTTTVHQQILQYLNNLFKDQHTDSTLHPFMIFAGLLPNIWNNNNNNDPSRKTHNNQRWETQISKWFVQQGHNLWHLRNDQVHDDNDEPNTTDLFLNQKIDKIYKLQEAISHYDKKLFQHPIEERYKLPTKQKMEWIEQTTKTIYQCIADHHKNMMTGQQDIRQFFNKQKKEDK